MDLESYDPIDFYAIGHTDSQKSRCLLAFRSNAGLKHLNLRLGHRNFYTVFERPNTFLIVHLFVYQTIKKTCTKSFIQNSHVIGHSSYFKKLFSFLLV